MLLPVNTTILDSYRFVWRNRREFAAFAFLPVLAVSIATAIALLFAGNPQTIEIEGKAVQFMGTQALAANFAASLVNTVVYVMFAIAWHRRYLVGGESTTIGAALRWSNRHWHFLGRFILMGLIIAGVAIPVGFVVITIGMSNPNLAAPALVVLMIMVGLLYSRMLMVFPAIAIGRPMNFRDSFLLTRGNSLRMLGISVLPGIPLMLAGLVITTLIGTSLTTVSGPTVTTTFLLSLIQQAFAFTGIAATVSALSIAYRDLTAQHPPI